MPGFRYLSIRAKLIFSFIKNLISMSIKNTNMIKVTNFYNNDYTFPFLRKRTCNAD